MKALLLSQDEREALEVARCIETLVYSLQVPGVAACMLQLLDSGSIQTNGVLERPEACVSPPMVRGFRMLRKAIVLLGVSGRRAGQSADIPGDQPIRMRRMERRGPREEGW